MVYIGLIYNGQPNLQELRTIARKYGAFPFALHIGEDGVTILDTRIHARNGRGNLKVWTLDKIEEALSEYGTLMKHAYPRGAEWILIHPKKRDAFPSHLEITVHQLEQETEPKVDQQGLTPYERVEILFRGLKPSGTTSSSKQ